MKGGRQIENICTIYWNKICPYRPQSNGHCERKNQQIKQALQFRDNIELTWDRELPSIQLEIFVQFKSFFIFERNNTPTKL